MKTEHFMAKVIENITNLMLLFLPMSMLANYFNGRLSFAILYFFIFLATLKHYSCYRKEKDVHKAAEQILVILFGLFFTFFLIGEQSSFDVLWILVLPVIAVMTASRERLKIWLYRLNAGVAFFLLSSYFFSDYVRYDSFALWSLLWATIFVSYMSYNYKKIQERLEEEIASYQHSLEDKIKAAIGEIELLNEDLNATQIEILQRLGTLGEYRSKETGTHVKRVGLYTKHLALLCGVSEVNAELYERAAPLHDIGKVGIEDAILNKPAKLTEEEYERMKEHAAIGENILSGSTKPLIQIAAEIAGGHHEKYDGSGYPRKLKGNEIPLSARIVAIADVFDALYSARVYKKGWSIEDIREHFQTQSVLHFDPLLCRLFLENIEDFITIYETNQ
jgi:HD superfamily phosphodiesterase